MLFFGSINYRKYYISSRMALVANLVGIGDGADAAECVLPSNLGLTSTTLEYGNRASGSAEPPAKKKKA